MKGTSFEGHKLDLVDFKLFSSMSEFELIKDPIKGKSQIGVGSFGSVNLALHKKTGVKYAIKIMNVKNIHNLDEINGIEREVRVHSELKHPNIIQFYDCFQENDCVYIILEYASNGNLYSHLFKKKTFTEKEAYRFFSQTCEAIRYLHSINVIHRDLKPENILLDSNWNVKVCDFGWCTEEIENPRNTFCGTYEYMAPEIVFRQPYDYRIDIWALGVLIYELLHGCAPFKGKHFQDIQRKIEKGDVSFSDSISEASKSLISKLLQANPSRRLSIEDIINHHWMKIFREPLSTIEPGIALAKVEKKQQERGISPLLSDRNGQKSSQINSSIQNLLPFKKEAVAAILQQQKQEIVLNNSKKLLQNQGVSHLPSSTPPKIFPKKEQEDQIQLEITQKRMETESAYSSEIDENSVKSSMKPIQATQFQNKHSNQPELESATSSMTEQIKYEQQFQQDPITISRVMASNDEPCFNFFACMGSTRERDRERDNGSSNHQRIPNARLDLLGSSTHGKQQLFSFPQSTLTPSAQEQKERRPRIQSGKSFLSSAQQSATSISRGATPSSSSIVQHNTISLVSRQQNNEPNLSLNGSFLSNSRTNSALRSNPVNNGVGFITNQQMIPTKGQQQQQPLSDKTNWSVLAIPTKQINLLDDRRRPSKKSQTSVHLDRGASPFVGQSIGSSSRESSLLGRQQSAQMGMNSTVKERSWTTQDQSGDLPRIENYRIDSGSSTRIGGSIFERDRDNSRNNSKAGGTRTRTQIFEEINPQKSKNVLDQMDSMISQIRNGATSSKLPVGFDPNLSTSSNEFINSQRSRTSIFPKPESLNAFVASPTLIPNNIERRKSKLVESKPISPFTTSSFHQQGSASIQPLSYSPSYNFISIKPTALTLIPNSQQPFIQQHNPF